MSLCVFIEGSPARHAVLENIGKAIDVKLRTLKSLSTTRWACRSEAVSAVRSNYSAIVQALTEIAEATAYAEVKAKAEGLIHQMRTFEFVFFLEMATPILEMILIVSQALQSPDLNIRDANIIVQNLQSALQKMRSDENDTDFKKAFQATKKLCEDNAIEMPEVRVRRVSSRIARNTSNQHIHGSKEGEMRIDTYYPFLDSLLSGIDERFSQETTKITDAFNNLMYLKITPEEMKILSEKFEFDVGQLQAEMLLLKEDNSTPPQNEVTTHSNCTRELANEWLKWLKEFNRTQTYSNLTKLIKEFVIIPVTSCSCERCFSKLVILQSKLRVVMKQDRLCHLLLPFVEQKLATEVKLDDIIDEFKKLENKRRMRL